MNELLRRQVLERDGYRCQICGKGKPDGVPLEVHHVIPRGMGGIPSRDAPENLITLCGEHHVLVHRGIWQIVRWDPDDPENGLVVVNTEGRRVPKDQLWFYIRHLQEEAAKRIDIVRKLWNEKRTKEWEAALVLAQLKEDKVHKALGLSWNEFVASHLGLKGSWADRAVKTVSWLADKDLLDEAVEADINQVMRVVEKARKGEMDRDEAKEWIYKTRELSAGDWAVEWRRAWGTQSFQKYLVVRAPREVWLVDGVKDEEELQGDVVVRVAALIKGRDKIKEEQ